MSLSTPEIRTNRTPHSPACTNKLINCRLTRWHGRQEGAALIVCLVLLVIMMVGGIAAMRGTSLNEKATSNQRNKTISLMAAESGVQAFHQWFRTNVNSANWPTTTATKNAWQASIPSSASPVSNNGKVGDFGYFWVDPAVVWGPTSSKTVSIKVTGHALSPTGAVLATTRINIEFQIPGLNLIPAMPIAPFGMAGTVGTFEAPNSNTFEILGGSGPAVATSNSTSSSLISTAIDGVDREANYTGTLSNGTSCSATNICVENSLGATWGNISWLQSTIEGLISLATSKPTQIQVISSLTTTQSPGPRGWILDSTWLGANAPPITIVLGDAEFKNGINYTGLVIVVGQTITITGGGGSTIYGGVVLLNKTESGGVWQSASYSVLSSGGGNMTIIYDSNPNGIASSESAFKSWEEE